MDREDGKRTGGKQAGGKRLGGGADREAGEAGGGRGEGSEKIPGRIQVRGTAAPVSLAVLALASVLGIAALLLGGGPAETVFAAVCAVFPPALIVLGATRRGSCHRTVVVTALALFAVLAAAFLLLFHYRGAGGGVPTVGAVPVPVVVLLGGMWLLPLAFVGLAYALTFERHGVGREDLERLRRLAAGGEGEAGEESGPGAKSPDTEDRDIVGRG